MVFKINVSHNGKTLKIETETEALIRNKIGEKISGNIVDPRLEGYELEITGTSDRAGFPGIKEEIGTHLRKILLTKNDKGMNTLRPHGLRLRKSVRGNEISEQINQINIKVIKEGSKKFEDLLGGDKEEGGEESKEGNDPAPKSEENKEEAKSEGEEKKKEEDKKEASA